MKRLALVLCLVLAGSAQAQVPFETQALRYWHQQPKCAPVTIEYVDEIPYFPSAWAGTYPGSCVVMLDADYWDRDFGIGVHHCAVIVHEWGHLLGYQHSDSGVMAPEPANPKVCKKGRKASRRPGPEAAPQPRKPSWTPASWMRST